MENVLILNILATDFFFLKYKDQIKHIHEADPIYQPSLCDSALVFHFEDKKENILLSTCDGPSCMVVFKAKSCLPAINTSFLQFGNPKRQRSHEVIPAGQIPIPNLYRQSSVFVRFFQLAAKSKKREVSRGYSNFSSR